MYALVTGASSGIGADIARILCKKGYDLILVARRSDKLEELKNELDCNCVVLNCDLSVPENCKQLFDNVKEKDIEILVNCAGFGVFGNFAETDLEKEIDMINTNITALHILTKLFVNKFLTQNRGYILNVASSASFAPGPMFSSYYASKAYVLRLSQAIWEELRGTNVHVSVLCPGPVDTEFNSVAKVSFTIGALSSDYVAEYAVKQMFKNKRLIVPGIKMKLARVGSKLVPSVISAKITHKFQEKKA